MEITLVPTAGLCNRINTILCAIITYDLYKIPTEIYWEKTKDCYADFSDLFEPLNHPNLKVAPLTKFYLKPGSKRNLFIPNLIRKFIFDKSYQGTEINNQDITDTCKNKKKIYITAYNRYCTILPIKFKVSEYFKPNAELSHKINHIVNTYYTANTIGVHVRRTDNIAAIKNSPIENFMKLMDKEIENNPNTNFYLATDSEETKKLFIKKYGDKIIPTQPTLNRNTTEGIKDAIIELFCLGHTNKIIGSKNSTYSLMASRLYNADLIF